MAQCEFYSESYCYLNSNHPGPHQHRHSDQIIELESKLLASERRVGEAEIVRCAAEELLEVARLRGDNELPHPANDALLWTARMQQAWEVLEAALEPTPPKPQPVEIKCGTCGNVGSYWDDGELYGCTVCHPDLLNTPPIEEEPQP